MGHTSIRISVETLLRRHAFTQYTVWGGGVQRSDLSRSALRMFKGYWTARGEPSLASWDQTLNDRQATLAAELIDGLEPRLLLIAEWTAKLVALVSRECKEVGLAVYLDRISGRCFCQCKAENRDNKQCQNTLYQTVYDLLQNVPPLFSPKTGNRLAQKRVSLFLFPVFIRYKIIYFSNV